MNRFTRLVPRLARAHNVGQDLLRTNDVLKHPRPHWDIDGLHRIQEHRIGEFERHMEQCINDWHRDDLDEYWNRWS